MRERKRRETHPGRKRLARKWKRLCLQAERERCTLFVATGQAQVPNEHSTHRLLVTERHQTTHLKWESKHRWNQKVFSRHTVFILHTVLKNSYMISDLSSKLLQILSGLSGLIHSHRLLMAVVWVTEAWGVSAIWHSLIFILSSCTHHSK